MPQETTLSKILSGLKRRGRKPQSRRKKIRLPFSGKIKAIASKLINSRIPDIEKLAPKEEHQITKPSFGIVAKRNPEYVAPAVKFNKKKIVENPQIKTNKKEKRNYGKDKIFSKAFSRFEILMKKLNKSGKRFIPISRDDVNVLTKIIPAFRTGGMVTNPTPAVLGEGGPESVHEKNMRFLEAQGARTREFAVRTGRETVAMGQEREKRMYDSGLSDVEKARRRVMDAGMRTSINVPEMLEDEKYRRKVLGKPAMSDAKYEKLLNMQAKKPKTEAERKQQKQTVLTKKADRLNERLQKVANNPRMPEDRKRKEMESIQRQINKTEFDLKKMTETEEERNSGLRETVKNLGIADPISLPSPEKIMGSESATPPVASAPTQAPETSYEGLSGIELLKAGIQNEGMGDVSFKSPTEISRIQEQVKEKAETQKSNEAMIKETMTRVDEKVGKAVSEGPQLISVPTGDMSRTQKGGGSSQIISGDSSFKVASKDNMSHPIWRTRLG
jgi:hypothetical protein